MVTVISKLDKVSSKAELLADIDAVRIALRSGKRFYVYILCRPNGAPLYVGKGVGDRVLNHEAEARNTTELTHKLNVIRSVHRKGSRVSYQAEAHARERYLITTIGRHDLKLGPLTNQTDGGEGTSNPSEESRQRRRESLWGDAAQDPERQIANRYFQKLTTVQSVTLKPVSTFRRAAALRRNRETFPLPPRQAATLAASAIENRIMLEPGAILPRRLQVDGVEFIIENGVGCDMLSSDMVVLADPTPTKETLSLTDKGFRYMVQELGASFLVDAGVLFPDSDTASS